MEVFFRMQKVSWPGPLQTLFKLTLRAGYAFAFAITSVVQMIGTWIILPLDGLVPKEEESSDDGTSITTTTSTAIVNVADNSVTEPLLSSNSSTTM